MALDLFVNKKPAITWSNCFYQYLLQVRLQWTLMKFTQVCYLRPPDPEDELRELPPDPEEELREPPPDPEDEPPPEPDDELRDGE
jgi:hypothetical protein